MLFQASARAWTYLWEHLSDRLSLSVPWFGCTDHGFYVYLVCWVFRSSPGLAVMTYGRPGVIQGTHAAQQAKSDDLVHKAPGQQSHQLISPRAEAIRRLGGEAWPSMPRPQWLSKPARRVPLTGLPGDALNEILEYCNCGDLTRLATSCKALRTAASSPALWRRLYVKDFDTSHKMARGLMDLFTIRQDPRLAYKHRFLERIRKVELAK